ncbi:MAG: hypothetical protein K8F91_24140, partial [Candidatus Obscuribacterales bacterium]|nr:hypothetical protein [Candidatus Obscuribacterales bacterium]
ALRLVILFGLVSQCIIHCLNAYWPIPAHLLNGLSVAGIFLLAISTAVVETACVKLKWTQTPEFIAYAVSLSLLGCLAVLLRGSL